MSSLLNYKRVLITGGTGSFGREFVAQLVSSGYEGSVVVYSRDEVKQSEMAANLACAQRNSNVKFFIGDVRDRDRLQLAMQGVDVVVHAAALKQVPTAEYNPMEVVKTNIHGAENIIACALATPSIKRVIALSTDKASSPVNLYGATKLVSDKLFVASNNLVGERDLRLSVVRYGNVMGSRGSVIPLYQRINDEGGDIPITDARMTRFNITLNEGVAFVLNCLESMFGGEIFVPKLAAYRITDLAEAFAPGKPIRKVGRRPGEKIHEEMISGDEGANVIEFEHLFVIWSSIMGLSRQEFFDEAKKKGLNPIRIMNDGFSYSSDEPGEFLNARDLRNLYS